MMTKCLTAVVIGVTRRAPGNQLFSKAKQEKAYAWMIIMFSFACTQGEAFIQTIYTVLSKIAMADKNKLLKVLI